MDLGRAQSGAVPAPPKEPLGLVFDLDGTLADSLRGIALALNRTLEIHGLYPHDLPAVRRFVGNGTRELLRRAAGGEVVEERLDALDRTFQEQYASTWREGTDVYGGIPGLLKALSVSGRRLAVLSNKPHAFTREIVDALFPEIQFAAVLGQRAGVSRKPDPAGALEIAALLSLPPSSCAMIGDSTIDLETGRNAGMQRIAVTWGYHDPAALGEADAMAGDVKQLAELLGVTWRGERR